MKQVYIQILSETECKGKTIDRIVELHGNTFFIFTDFSFCVYNVNFYDRKLNIKSAIGNYGLMKLGFISETTYNHREKKDKEKFEADRIKNDIRVLKRLNSEYPNVLKN